MLNLANEGLIKLLISPFILDETAKVLQRQFGWGKENIESALLAIQEIATLIHPSNKISLIKEKDSDNRILECAVDGEADFIITGDTKHILPIGQYQGIRILKPAEFLALER